MEVIVDGLGTAKDGKEELGSEVVLDWLKKGPDIWNSATDVVPLC